MPRLSASTVITTYISVGVAFAIIGAVVLGISLSVVDKTVRYDNISNCTLGDTCTISIAVDDDMNAPVFFYYQLTNVYQNHRRYVMSRDQNQLRALTPDPAQCAPLEHYGDAFSGSIASLRDQILYPCGLIANTFFLDNFTACVLRAANSCYPLDGTSWKKDGIAWPSDISHLFVDRSPYQTETTISPRGFTLPAVTDEDFAVWMRTAAISKFTKLYRIISDYDLKKGDILHVTINNQYDVSPFSGEKAIVISTCSGLGGRNVFLGVAYFVVSFFCLCGAWLFFHQTRNNPKFRASLD